MAGFFIGVATVIQKITKMKKYFEAYWCSDSGATAVEYGLIVAALVLAIMVLIFTMGDGMVTVYETMSTQISEAASDAAE